MRKPSQLVTEVVITLVYLKRHSLSFTLFLSPKSISVKLLPTDVFVYQWKMAAEILNFLDVVNNYSSVYLIVTTVASAVLWIISSINSPNVWLTGPGIIIDIMSGAANFAEPYMVNKVHAVGSGLHCFMTPIFWYRDADSGDETFSCFIIWLSEILELSAIVVSLDGWQQTVAIIFLAVGGILAVFYLCADTEVAKNKLVGSIFQAVYFLIVVVAATSDWSRLLWLLPEVPLETLLLILEIFSDS